MKMRRHKKRRRKKKGQRKETEIGRGVKRKSEEEEDNVSDETSIG